MGKSTTEIKEVTKQEKYSNHDYMKKCTLIINYVTKHIDDDALDLH